MLIRCFLVFLLLFSDGFSYFGSRSRGSRSPYCPFIPLCLTFAELGWDPLFITLANLCFGLVARLIHLMLYDRFSSFFCLETVQWSGQHHFIIASVYALRHMRIWYGCPPGPCHPPGLDPCPPIPWGWNNEYWSN